MVDKWRGGDLGQAVGGGDPGTRQGPHKGSGLESQDGRRRVKHKTETGNLDGCITEAAKGPTQDGLILVGLQTGPGRPPYHPEWESRKAKKNPVRLAPQMMAPKAAP